jgi:hypothetical protein
MSEKVQSGLKMVTTVCAILLGILFLISGGWKVLMPFQSGEILEQAQVPAGFGVLGAAALGTLELFAAVLLFVPQFRRLGGLLSAGLMIFFIAWVSFYYHVLVGRECGCFPIIKRAVGPGFFVSDGIMLLMALAVYFWSPKVLKFRVPAFALASVALLACLSFGVAAKSHYGSQIPTPLIVDGKPENLNHGKVFVFFYDPSCEHCDAASKFMSTFAWKDTKVIAIPTVNPQWADAFLHDTHLKASTSLELKKMKQAFPFVDPPYGVALVDGSEKATFNQAQFNKPLPKPELQKLGFVE